LSWLVLGHWDRCIQSDNFSGVDPKERLSKGVWLLRREQTPVNRGGDECSHIKITSRRVTFWTKVVLPT
jgi:hypothetical protein